MALTSGFVSVVVDVCLSLGVSSLFRYVTQRQRELALAVLWACRTRPSILVNIEELFIVDVTVYIYPCQELLSRNNTLNSHLLDNIHMTSYVQSATRPPLIKKRFFSAIRVDRDMEKWNKQKRRWSMYIYKWIWSFLHQQVIFVRPYRKLKTANRIVLQGCVLSVNLFVLFTKWSGVTFKQLLY